MFAFVENNLETFHIWSFQAGYLYVKDKTFCNLWRQAFGKATK